mgnify:CR=1 FL=1
MFRFFQTNFFLKFIFFGILVLKTFRIKKMVLKIWSRPFLVVFSRTEFEVMAVNNICAVLSAETRC